MCPCPMPQGGQRAAHTHLQSLMLPVLGSHKGLRSRADDVGAGRGTAMKMNRYRCETIIDAITEAFPAIRRRLAGTASQRRTVK